VARFAEAGREEARRAAAVARERAEQRRAQRKLENEARYCPKCPENAKLAAAALSQVLARDSQTVEATRPLVRG
jgi:hypothetical protein